MKKFILTLAAVIALTVSACVVPGNNQFISVGPNGLLPYGWFQVTRATPAGCTMYLQTADGRSGSIPIAQPNNTAVLIEAPITAVALNNDCAAQVSPSGSSVPSAIAFNAVGYLN